MRELWKKISWRRVLPVGVVGGVVFFLNHASRPQGSAALLLQAAEGGAGAALAFLLGSLRNRRYGYGAAALMFVCDACRLVRDPAGVRAAFYFLVPLSVAAAMVIFTPPKRKWTHRLWKFLFAVAAFAPLLLSAWTMKEMIEIRFNYGIPVNLPAAGTLFLALSAASLIRFRGIRTIDRDILIAGCLGGCMVIRQLMLVESVY